MTGLIGLCTPLTIERTLFTLQWLSDPELRQRSHAGLNKGEASNSLPPCGLLPFQM
jgi:TnpA family transposase